MTFRERLARMGIEPLPPEARAPMYIFFAGFIAMVALLSAAAKVGN